jgi:hypothetical protein
MRPCPYKRLLHGVLRVSCIAGHRGQLTDEPPEGCTVERSELLRAHKDSGSSRFSRANTLSDANRRGLAKSQAGISRARATGWRAQRYRACWREPAIRLEDMMSFPRRRTWLIGVPATVAIVGGAVGIALATTSPPGAGHTESLRSHVHSGRPTPSPSSSPHPSGASGVAPTPSPSRVPGPTSSPHPTGAQPVASPAPVPSALATPTPTPSPTGRPAPSAGPSGLPTPVPSRSQAG